MSAGSGKFFLTLITVSISFAAFSLGAAHLRSDPADTMHLEGIQTMIGNGQYIRAEQLLEEAIRRDCKEACYYMGMLHARKGEKSKAAFYFKKGAALNDANSEFKLAQLYSLGWGVPKDKARAFAMFKKISDRFGYAEAMLETGRMLLTGEGTAVNRSEAVRYLKQISAPGSSKVLPAAQYLLGSYYLEEAEMTGDTDRQKEFFGKGLQLLRLAGSGKVSEAWITLGNIYYNGKFDLESDREKARLCFYAAVAIDGSPKAQYQLGVIAMENRETEEAHRWMQLASRQRNSDNGLLAVTTFCQVSRS